ncbi:efflux RND transporter periplasmic adaptor subunit [Desulfallas sp. Bu1-1]|uniref:efflux RND transporter periplasmic adaptor subunit n=1 Tax=Desulfallas sp. Bu1-1 TaxID=2787620 RepID=UPI00189CCBEE|nr:efflux RND transporter periplasmic adaptor subunit [Desulfallas sp. Bu1-1]MBF7081574.1 efflux RND transporter periplasmic adaptor subunit [Desulfallas sp. Bu1-1]
MVLAGCGKGKDQVKAEGDELIVSVRTAAAEKGVLADTTVVSGKLEALASSDVVPGGQGGKVYSVNVQVGDRVSKGQTLVTLEHAALAAAVRQAEQGVAQAEAALEVSRITYEQAKANYERGKQLYESGAIPQAGPTGYETAYEIPYKQAKIDYEQAKPAMLAAARATLAGAREQYNNAFIKSPISGVVTAVNVDPGELASPASPTPVVSVVNLDKVVVKATVTENLINKIKQGQQVPVLVSAVSAKPFTGTITNIALAADPVSKAYPIKVQIDNPGYLLKPGMFAEVQLSGEQKETLLVPREAVVKSNGKDIVWVVKDGKAGSRPVTVGISDGKKIEIKKGLKEGEQVVVSGQDTLQENAKVEIKN